MLVRRVTIALAALLGLPGCQGRVGSTRRDTAGPPVPIVALRHPICRGEGPAEPLVLTAPEQVVDATWCRSAADFSIDFATQWVWTTPRDERPGQIVVVAVEESSEAITVESCRMAPSSAGAPPELAVVLPSPPRPVRMSDLGACEGLPRRERQAPVQLVPPARPCWSGAPIVDLESHVRAYRCAFAEDLDAPSLLDWTRQWMYVAQIDPFLGARRVDDRGAEIVVTLRAGCPGGAPAPPSELALALPLPVRPVRFEVQPGPRDCPQVP
jgi:hypothetical protein